MADLWHYAKNGQQMDPVSSGQLKQLAQNGSLSPDDLVWKPGMANWVPASKVAGLFPNNSVTSSPPPAPAPAADEAEPLFDDVPLKRRRPADDEDLEDRPRRRRRDEEDDEDFEERPRRRKRRRKQQSSGGMGLLIGGGIGAVVLLCLVCGGIIYFAGFGGTSPNGSRSWSLASGKAVSYYLRFEKGKRVTLRVNSKSRSDVDLFIYDGGREIMSDQGDSQNCVLIFTPSETKSYKVEVQNRVRMDVFGKGRNGSNSGTLTWETSDVVAQNPPNNNNGNNKPPINPNPNPFPGGGNPNPNPGGNFQVTDFSTGGVLAPRQKKTYKVQLQDNTRYLISLDSTTKSFDPVLELKDDTGRVVGFNDDGPRIEDGLNSRLNYNCNRTGTYEIIVSDLGGTRSGPFQLKVQH